jgi:hypothetical protein
MTDKMWLVLLTWAFAGVATLSMAAYVPQVVASFRSPSARRGTVLFTWWVWSFGAVIEVLYMAFVAKDWLLVATALVHLVACTLVATAGTLERLRWSPGPTVPVGSSDSLTGVEVPAVSGLAPSHEDVAF